MKATAEKGKLTILLPKSIGADNSEPFQKELFDILEKNPGMQLVLDAQEMEYISSSGLRVFLQVGKKKELKLRIQNASPSLYEIFEKTGFTNLFEIERQMSCINVDGCPVIGEGAFGTVYRLNQDTVVKVYKDGENALPLIREEMDKARQAFILGVPTAIPFGTVRVGNQYGAMFELIDAQNCNELVLENPGALDELIPQYASFLKTLHGIEIESGELPYARDIFLKNLSEMRSYFSEALYERLKGLLEDLSRGNHLLHGDVQLKNVMKTGNEIMLIDMDKFCVGDPVFEFAALYATYVGFNEDDPENTLHFMGVHKEAASRIFRDTLRSYLGNPGKEVLEEAERKIQTVGYLRFLAILILEWKDVNPLKTLRIEHSVGHLEKLAYQVDTLAL